MHPIGIPTIVKKESKIDSQKPDRKSGFFGPVFLRDFLRFICNYLIISDLC